MSFDSSSQLRDILRRLDLSAPAIQGAAGAMMKHYDKSPGVAVVEWRNALHHARGEQYLPLLYVANEVLQNSKRNRGNKFLEAFSPTLGQSLIFICDKSPPALVETIRRTIKIWAERHVFSIRYVNELLKGLDPYRKEGKNSSKKSTVRRSSGNNSRFSPVSTSTGTTSTNATITTTSSSSSSSSLVSPSQGNKKVDGKMTVNDDNNNNDGDDLFGDVKNNDGVVENDDDDDDDDDDDLFGNASKKLLKIDVDMDRASKATMSVDGGQSSHKKRRRSSNELKADTAIAGKSRRRSLVLLSTNSLMELWNKVSALQTNYERVSRKINEIKSTDNNGSDGVKGIDTLMGDELLAEYKKVLTYERQIEKQRQELHSIAQKRRSLEIDAVRYLPWLERALKHDKDDIAFCEKYKKQLDLFRLVYEPTKLARGKRLREEKQRQEDEEKERWKKEEEEERRKFMQSAMSKQTEAQPGMVWNRATGEYQHLNQDESWRD